MTVIELGLREHESEPEAEPSRPSRARQLRGALAALTVVLVGITGASARPAEPRLTEVAVVPTAPAYRHVISDGVLYSLGAQHGETSRTLTAHDLRDGSVRWAVPVGDNVLNRAGLWVNLFLQVKGDLVLLNSADSTIGVDAASSRTLWTARHRITPTGTDGIGYSSRPVLAGGDGGPVVAPVGDYPPEELRVQLRGFDLTTGAELWVSPPVRSGDSLPGADAALLVVTADHRVEVWDARTGTVRQRITGPDDRPRGVTAGDGLIYVTGVDSTLTAYAVDTLERRWRAPVPPGDGGGMPCGRYVCHWQAAGDRYPDQGRGRTIFLDAADGRPVGGMVDGWAAEERDGHLLMRDDDGKLTRTVDPATGRTLIDLTQWPEPVWSDDRSPTVLMRSGDGPRMWFGVLDPGATAVRIVGSVPHRSYRCQSSATHVACQTAPEELRIWRYH
ncbi:PQQ-binding-like beta-propeller repeat protein [Polymorphospora rubra]|uniref:outer membrane protein assembly factor BamB family protein n=1 Tax=Polymorphospora rubra TaxID=338584 RepID=UPI0033DB1C71